MAAPGNRDDLRRERERMQALLRRVRLEAGLRQQDLADRLGLPQSFISKVELGERRIDVVELRRLCAAAGIPLTTFVARLEADLDASEIT